MPKARRTLGSATLRHDKVVNLAGEDVGKVEELMIDVTTGRVAYVVLSFGGFLGIIQAIQSASRFGRSVPIDPIPRRSRPDLGQEIRIAAHELPPLVDVERPTK